MRAHTHATANIHLPVHVVLNSLRHKLDTRDAKAFGSLALEVFACQRQHNATYAKWLELAGFGEAKPKHWTEIPCAPIELFRTQDVRSGHWQATTTFTSSGTTGQATSRHPIRDLQHYQSACAKTFENQLGPLHKYQLLALLPNYLARKNSGLIAMIDHFLKHSAKGSGYFLNDHDALRAVIRSACAKTQPILLWGVTYALLDLVEEDPLELPEHSLVIETGGMKGRRRELTREELHEKLAASITLATTGAPARISSEYGMTEMCSQAYLNEQGWFVPAPTLRLLARDIFDPFELRPPGRTGAANVYDLANLDTLSFFQTDDLCRVDATGNFQILGRTDGSALRGCNLLLEDAGI